MSQSNFNETKQNLMLMELVIRELREDLKTSLLLISIKKQNSFKISKYESTKKQLLEFVHTDQMPFVTKKWVCII